MSFAALRKQSKNAIEKLGKKVDEEKKGGYTKDERFWNFTVNAAGVGSAVIRFLPAPEGQEMPYVKRFEYFVKHNGKYYVENCRSTLGDKDPMNEHFFAVRGDGKDESKKIAANAFKRSTNYIANIYVVNDPANPENNGKVFLYKFGSRIFGFLESAIKPEFDSETPFNPFDLWEGANFNLKARTVDKQRSYDKCSFDACGPLLDDDEELEKIWKQEHDLQAEIAAGKFKSYDDLKKKLDFVLAAPGNATPGNATPGNATGSGKSQVSDDGDDDEDFTPPPVKTPKVEAATRKSETKKIVDDEDDDMSKFRSLLGDD